MKSSVRSRGTVAALGVGLCLAVLPAIPAQAQPTVSVPCNVPALRNAIIASNASGADLSLARNCTYTITDAYSGDDGLPQVTGTYTINGVGVTIRRSSSAEFRILHVGPTGRLTLNHVTLTGGQTEAVAGGGIYNQGSLSMTQVTVRDTRTQYGFGGALYNEGTLSMQRGALTNNTGYLGGGILNCGTSATLNNVTVSGNSAENGGGLNNNCQSSMALNATRVQNNNSPEGGGIINWATLEATGTRITSNTGWFGGGIQAARGPVTLTDSRVTDNTASYVGGGIYVATYSGASVALSDTRVENNTPDNCYPPGSVVGCSNVAMSPAESPRAKHIGPEVHPRVREQLDKNPNIRLAE
ncbi:hypothetical protein ACFY15_35940 [Streptomyces sp. NPDC001373]|uniref:hypothetical protein n=1 Tax=Streptomyces sp. NPDC001373 TaxID=3364565 RepID=UPI003691F84D